MSINDDWGFASGASLPPLTIDPEVRLTQEVTREAYDYWQSRRGDRSMPARKDLNPKDFRNILPYVALIELQRKEKQVDYLVRLIGTRLEQIFGPVTGKTLSEFLPPENEARMRFVCDEALRLKKPLGVSSRLAFKRMHWLRLEGFLGPLSDEAGEVSMLFLTLFLWPSPLETPGKGTA